MVQNSKTDSLFTFNMEGISGQKTWSDIRLIHESDSGWCVVYSGLYRGRRVAIKGLKREFRSSELHRSLLQKEFEVTSIMNHQNIVAAMSMADVPGIGTAILLEYIEGLTLTEYLASHASVEGSRIADIIRQVCSAVDYIHSRQTIHCDLKPSNIMITHSGFVKIIDFGISRGNGFERLDFPGGTIGYTAPENFNSESGVSVAVDIYSIGMLLEKMDRKGMFRGVWRKCLSSDPDKRPASVHEIPELLNNSLINNRKRRIRYRWIGVVSGITAIAVCIFLISRKEQVSNYGGQQDTAIISEASGLKELMNHVMNDVEITEEESRMLDSMSYKLGKAAFDCGNWLINEARSGGIKGADHAQWAEYHFYHLCVWLDEEYFRLNSWVGVFLNRQAEDGGIEVRFYIVCESQDESLHSLLREKLDLLPGEKREGDYWWFAPASEDLQKMHFVSVPDRQAIRSRIEQMLARLNVITLH
ncbi:MAG: serine/threonine protein kinase [Muribaculaceae bacterium]|nr:serine/threonine protein kinase [Muribaculaceae bacterium]